MQTNILEETDLTNPQSYVVCPACGEEWNRLFPCRFKNENLQNDVTYLCVQCGETAKSIRWIITRHPFHVPVDGWNEPLAWSKWPNKGISGGFVNVIEKRETKREWVPLWRNQIAGVHWNPFKEYEVKYFIQLRSGSYPIRVVKTGAEEQYYSENMIDAWQWIKAEMLKTFPMNFEEIAAAAERVTVKAKRRI